PIIGLPVVHVVGSGLVPRYFLVTALATVGIPIVLGRFQVGSIRQLFLGGVITLAWLAQAGQVLMPGRHTIKDPARDDADLMVALSRAEPVVVANAVEYLQLWFYTPEAQRSHLLYLVDEDLSVRHLGSSTADSSLIALTHWSDVKIVPFVDFIKP